MSGDAVYKNVSLDEALGRDPNSQIQPTQVVQNVGIGTLTIIQQATQASPVILSVAGTVDIPVPKDGSLLLAEGTFTASPLLSFQMPYSSPGGGLVARIFYDRQVGNIRIINDTGPVLTVTYQLIRIDGKVGSN